MLLGIFRASLFRNSLTGKKIKPRIPGRRLISAGEGTIKTDQNL